MPGYLLDTNHFSAWERQDARILARVHKIPPENFIWLCPIVLGEIEFGLRTAPMADADKQRKCREFVSAQARHSFQEMVVHVGEGYAHVLHQIYERYPKVDPDWSTQKHLTSLPVDINDAWFAAVALTHNLILVTNDEMKIIRECVPELRVDNWLA